MTGLPRCQPDSEQDYLEDNIATVAFHLGRPGAQLSVSNEGLAGLLVEPGEVLAEISRRLTGTTPEPTPPSRGIVCSEADIWREQQAAKAAAAKEREESLRTFFSWAMRNGPWDGCGLDGSDIQDKAEHLGLIVKTKYDPATHGERAEFEEGDDFYEFAPGLAVSSTDRAPFKECEYPNCTCPRRGRCGNASASVVPPAHSPGEVP